MAYYRQGGKRRKKTINKKSTTTSGGLERGEHQKESFRKIGVEKRGKRSVVGNVCSPEGGQEEKA